MRSRNSGASATNASNQAAQRRLSFGLGPQVQRQPDSSGSAAAAPSYRDCTESITGVSDANEQLEAARIRARDFVQAAIAALGKTPTAGSVLATALARHFVDPTEEQRVQIRATYRQMLPAFRVPNFICNRQNICGDFQAGWLADDDLIHVCPLFWALDRTCQAIVLVHEAAHDAGINVSGPHPFGRGTATYPAGNKPPPDGETPATRMENADAYGFFAAHIWRSGDTGKSCR
ncbi:MAG: M35 family metallopeptidase [Pyrinomonadaceae bacterium]|nr:M35 family metallopeptidase [Pyrinomonadaceae bacterium]